MYPLDSLPQTRAEPPQFLGTPQTCLIHYHSRWGRGAGGQVLPCPPPSTALLEHFTRLPPPPQSPESKLSLSSGGLARRGSRIRRGAPREESWTPGSEKAGGWRGSPAARVPLRAAEPGQPSPSPGEVVSVRLGTPRSPARAGAVGGWVSATGLFLALHSLRKSGASALPAPARSLGARTPGPDSGAERSTGWGPRGARRGGAG